MNRLDNHQCLFGGLAGRPAGARPASDAGAASRNASPSLPRVTPRLAGLLLVMVVLVFLFAEIGSVATQARPAALMDRQRFGFVATTPGWREKFDLEQLGAGWAVDFAPTACATRPAGIDRAIVIYVWPDYVLYPDIVGPMVDNHPGSLWIIGNEPDCIWQSNLEPEVYARMHHDLYYFIKGRDPTAQIAPGGIVQATPLRLEWLDLVLAEYDRMYGGLMPVDVWNIHNAIVTEKRGGAGEPTSRPASMLTWGSSAVLMTATTWRFSRSRS